MRLKILVFLLFFLFSPIGIHIQTFIAQTVVPQVSGSCWGQTEFTFVSPEERNIQKHLVCITVEGSDGQKGRGTGLLVSVIPEEEKAFIITEEHVVRRAKKIRANFYNSQKIYPAKKKESWKDKDIAILTIPLKLKDIPPAAFHPLKFITPFNKDLENAPISVFCECALKVQGIMPGGVGKVCGDTAKVHLSGHLYCGDSGTPVFIKKHGVIVGLIREPSLKRHIHDENGNLVDSIYVGPFDIVPAYYIIQVLKKYELDFDLVPMERLLSATLGASQEKLKKSFDSTLACLEAEIKKAIGKKKQMFTDKSRYDLVIDAYYETITFIERVRRNPPVMDSRRLEATNFFAKGLVTKALKKHGFKEAKEYFEMAISADSIFPSEARCQLALYHLRCTDNKEEAQRQLTIAHINDPMNPEVWRCWVVYYLRMAKFDSALTYLNRIGKVFPEDDPRISLYWGVYYDPYWLEGKGGETRKVNLDTARYYYRRSFTGQSDFIRSPNNLVMSIAEEIRRDTLNLLPQKRRDDLMILLEQHLARLKIFVDYGLADPRFISTVAYGYAICGACDNACRYLKRTKEVMKDPELQLSHADRESLKEEAGKIIKLCNCKYE